MLHGKRLMALTGVVVLAGSSLALGADTTGPRLTIVGPAHGSIITAPTQIGVTSSDLTSVRSVTFAVDGDVKAVDSSRPYGFRFDPHGLRPGGHRLSITAIDRLGHRSTTLRTYRVASSRSGRVAADSSGPSLSLSAPANGTVMSGVRTLTATVSDPSGIRDVRFYVNGALRKTEQLKPYQWSFNWSNLSAGSYALKVVARDGKGFTTTTTRSYTVAERSTAPAPTPPPSTTPPPPPAGDTTAPVVTLSGPADGSVVSSAATVTAAATDASGVAKVQFLVDGVVRATDTTSPYAFTFSPSGLTPGAHVVVAIATDASGNAGQASRTYVVPAPADSAGPTLAFGGPAAGSSLTGSVKISGTASDPSGVREVRFFLDGTLKQTDLTAPYEWTSDWSALTSGSHTVRMDAYDTLGNMTSATRSFIVPSITSTPPPPPSNGASDAEFQSSWNWIRGEGPLSTSALGPWYDIQAAGSDRVVAVASPRQGISPYSIRFTVKNGDVAANGHRAEVLAGGKEYEGTDNYYSFAEMFPAGFDSGKWTLFHQIHGGSGRPVVAFQGGNNAMQVMVRGGNPDSPTERQYTIEPSIAKDVWHNFVYHVRWYADSRGLVEVWHRIPSQDPTWEKVLSVTGPVGYKAGGTWHTPYPKIGLYRDPAITWTTTVYQGGLLMRASSFGEAAKLFG